jgi:hypothetical protein
MEMRRLDMFPSVLMTGVLAAVVAFAEGADSRVDAARAARLIAAIEGSYSLSFEAGTVDGSYVATDRLTIAKASDTAVHFSLRLNFYNGHSCSAEGVAEYQPGGEFVYRERSDKMECVLEIVPTAKAILLRDATGNCRMTTCGVRGSYEHASFARSLRQVPGAK